MLIAAENRRENGCIVLFSRPSVCGRSFQTPVFLCSYLKLKCAALTSSSSSQLVFWWIKERNITEGSSERQYREGDKAKD